MYSEPLNRSAPARIETLSGRENRAVWAALSVKPEHAPSPERGKGLRVQLEARVRIASSLVEGVSIRGTERLTSVTKP